MTRENLIYERQLSDLHPDALSWLFVQLRNLGVQTPLFATGWLMCSPGFIKSTARGFGSGVETRRLIFFRARYNPCRCEAVIRAAVIRPWTLELHPTDETDYSSYQINLCLLSLAGLRPLSPSLSLYSLSRLSRLYTRTHSIRAR